LSRFPGGFVAVGDAVCSFNPVYGQGMSVAAAAAETLATTIDELGGDLGRLPNVFFPRLAKVVDVPWMIAAGADYGWPAVEGVRPTGTSVMNRYLDRIHRAARVDKNVAHAFYRVATLTAPPTTLFAPRVVWGAVVRGGA